MKSKKQKTPEAVEAVEPVVAPRKSASVIVKSLTEFHKEGGLRWKAGQVRTIQRTLYEHYLTIGGQFVVIGEED